MKRVCMAFLFALLTMFALGAGAQADVSKVTVILDPWPPYSIGETGSPATGGYFIEVAKEVFKRTGVEAEIVLYPWKRCLEYMKSGEKDVLLGVTKTAEREQFMTYTDPVVVDRVVFFYAAEKFPQPFAWNSFEDLKAYTIGMTAGYNYGEEFAKAVKDLGLKTDEGPSETKSFEKLAAGRMELFICYEISGKYWVNQDPKLQGKIVAAEKPVLAELPFYLAISNKSQALPLLPKINEAIAAMKADGTLDKLLGK